MPEQGPQLRAAHIPDISPWWPLAPGWWALLAVAVAAIVALVVMLRRRAAWRRHVDVTLADLRAALIRYADDGDAAAFAASANQLLRRVARTRDPRSVTLAGSRWHEALAAMAPKQDVRRLAALDAALYRRHVKVDATAVARDIEAWVRVALPRSSMRSRAQARAPGRRASHDAA